MSRIDETKDFVPVRIAVLTVSDTVGRTLVSVMRPSSISDGLALGSAARSSRPSLFRTPPRGTFQGGPFCGDTGCATKRAGT